MAELDLSRAVHCESYYDESGVTVYRNSKDDHTMVLGFEGIEVIIDDIQAIDIMNKLAHFFNYELVDLDA
ncbi:hypothetical protein [Neisseria zoodegmatis]|uniref:Uncharacterized protein n=1 Tax=Neisseria zoodegmatis TaxID=326523 RepID=A0AB38DMZ9_9NEIS|nr:hypothetical protein [Neisseria zoodegmatis]OSI09287.1 hypothetical protein BWD10_10200 [Neisseria zoodegmatis]SNU78674.1 Uncharacterised protein [Neisseria zoodegmatis]